jgi:branched-chain amino acid transport system substrate-binding protein
MTTMIRVAQAIAAVAIAVATAFAQAQSKYDPGASDTKIRIGQTMAYSGPASAYGTIGRVQAAYLRKINDEGGINGRKIEFLSVDDGYSPPKTVEAVRRLVEQDRVLLLFQTAGTAPNSAIQKYLNTNKVPQLFVGGGASRWNDPQGFPWTMGWHVNYLTEARAYAAHILASTPRAKVAVLFQNDDFGKEYLQGLKDGLGDKAGMIVAQTSFEVTDSTVDSQIVQLQASGADVFVNVATPRFAAQAIRKAHDIGWRPVQYVTNVSTSVSSVLAPAGLTKSVGLLSSSFIKDPTDPQWANDTALNEWRAFMAKYYPEGDPRDFLNLYGYVVAQTLVHVLRQCGDDLTRANVMKQAASLKGLRLEALLPGITLNTSLTDFAPIETLQLIRFDGRSWIPFGEVRGRQ